MTTNERILAVAFSQVGVAEIAGAKHSDRVLQYFSEIGHSWVKDDETAWCAAAANWVCKNAMVESTGKLNARSFLDVGEAVDIKNAQPGDVVILWRGTKEGSYGHVAFFVDQDSKNVILLGGNQNNRFCLGSYGKDRILGVRRLKSKFDTTQATDA